MDTEKIINGMMLLIFPFILGLIEILLRIILGSSVCPVLGIMLSTIGLGSVLPYVYFDNLLMHKILSVDTQNSYESGRLTTTRIINLECDSKKVESLRKLSILVFFGCLLIWIGTLILAITDVNDSYIVLRISLGSVTALMAMAFQFGG